MPHLPAVPSVGNEEMDDEHEECVGALNHLAAARDVSSLQVVLEVLTEHFGHEETLLDQHVYTDGGEHGGFSAAASARKTHYNDHARMLQSCQEELEQAKGRGGSVSSSFVKQLLEHFATHADAYDGAYAEELHAALQA